MGVGKTVTHAQMEPESLTSTSATNRYRHHSSSRFVLLQRRRIFTLDEADDVLSNDSSVVLRVRVKFRFGDGGDITDCEDVWIGSGEEGRVDVDTLRVGI